MAKSPKLEHLKSSQMLLWYRRREKIELGWSSGEDAGGDLENKGRRLRSNQAGLCRRTFGGGAFGVGEGRSFYKGFRRL